MGRSTRMLVLALRLARRGTIDKARLDRVADLADQRALNFPESLSDLVASYERACEEHREIIREGNAHGFSDWQSALAESSAQAMESERARVVEYCARFNVSDPIKARDMAEAMADYERYSA